MLYTCKWFDKKERKLFRMDRVQLGLTEAFTEIDLAVSSARRSQIDLLNRLQNLYTLLDELEPSERSKFDGKKALLAQRKMASIENAIRQIEKRTARCEAIIK